MRRPGFGYAWQLPTKAMLLVSGEATAGSIRLAPGTATRELREVPVPKGRGCNLRALGISPLR